MRVAGEMYDRARFKEEEGLPQTSRRFDAVAKTAIRQMEMDIERGIKPMTNKDYIRAINNYLLPFFGKRMLNNINGEVVREYEQWRNEKMKRVPISSTLATRNSAFKRIVEVAIERGWLSDKVPVAQLSRKGRKGTARPALTKAEVEALLAFLPKWSDSGKTAKAREMRLLLRDYIKIFAGYWHAMWQGAHEHALKTHRVAYRQRCALCAYLSERQNRWTLALCQAHCCRCNF